MTDAREMQQGRYRRARRTAGQALGVIVLATVLAATLGYRRWSARDSGAVSPALGLAAQRGQLRSVRTATRLSMRASRHHEGAPFGALVSADSSAGRLESGSFELTGTVLDATGGPIAGAVIVARPVADPGRIARDSSNELGEFRLSAAAGPVDVEARAEAYSRAVRRVEVPLTDLILVLAPAAAIHGRVLHAWTREPVADVVVTASNRNGILAPEQSALSRADGSFSIEGLPAGGYELAGISASFRSESRWVSVGVGESRDSIELLADPASVLKVALRTAGEPCARGWLELAGPVSLSVPSGPDGRLVVDGVLPGRYSLTAKCQQARTRQELAELGTQPVERIFDLERGLELRGSVRRRGGQPVVGATVQVTGILDAAPPDGQRSAPASSQCVTDAGGRFACGGLEPGAYECVAVLPGRAISERASVLLDDTAAEDVTLLVRDSASIRVSLEANGERLGSRALLARRERAAPVQAVREADAFVFEELELGSYDVFAGIGPGDASHSTRVELTEVGQVASVSLRLPRALELSGRVVDGQGEPIADAWVDATPSHSLVSADSGDAVLTDADGRFHLEGLANGLYDVHATTPSGEATVQEIAAGAQAVNVRVLDYGSIQVAVAGASDASDPSLEYGLHDGSITRLPGGRGGRWSLPWLAPGTYDLVVSSGSGKAMTQLLLQPGSHEQVQLVIEPTH